MTSGRFTYRVLTRSGSCAPLKRALALGGIASCAALLTSGTQDANANGETRALTMIHSHTNETLSIVYKQNGSFDSDALQKLNWFLRDWRIEEPISMAPQLFDVIWYVYREVGATTPIKIMSAYRSPGTNAMLRRRSRAVAKESQHMRGNAMDVHIPGVSMAKVREIGMRLQRGGVGYYPSAGSPFVHLDVGSVRSWPRMPRQQLEHLFPDGKTVHLPADGKPLANYEAALAEVQARGGSALDYGTVTSSSGKSLWALLFGGDEEDDAREASGRGRNTRVARGGGAAPPPQVAAVSSGDGVNAWGTSRLIVQPTPVERSVRVPQVAVARPDIAAPLTPIPAPAAPAAATAAGEDKTAIQIAALPVPPIRPRGERFAALVASIEPVPPIRPSNLDTFVAALPTPTAPVPEAERAAAVAITGMPLPPSRPVVAVAALSAPSQGGDAASPGLPAILSRSAAPRESEVLVHAYAAVSAPVPPSRPHDADSAPREAVPSLAAIPHETAAAPAIAPPRVQPRRTNPVALVGARPTAQTRPARVVAVTEPPVEREVKRAVVAMSFSESPAKGGSGSGGFGGAFIRPMALSFSRPGE